LQGKDDNAAMRKYSPSPGSISGRMEHYAKGLYGRIIIPPVVSWPQTGRIPIFKEERSGT